MSDASEALDLHDSAAQSSLPSEKAALLVFFGLFASGQVKMRRIQGWYDLGGAHAVPA